MAARRAGDAVDNEMRLNRAARAMDARKEQLTVSQDRRAVPAAHPRTTRGARDGHTVRHDRARSSIQST